MEEKKASKAVNMTGQEIWLPPLLKTGVETPGNKKQTCQPRCSERKYSSVDSKTNLSPLTTSIEVVVEKIMPRSQYPAEHEDRKGAPTFPLSSRRVAFGAHGWLILLTAPETKSAKEKSCYLHLRLDK